MRLVKFILIIITCILLLYILAPKRSPFPITSDKVIEITYMSPGGPIGGTMDDMVRAFEKENMEAHRKDPSKPLYRVVSGQTGAVDQNADPTRFLISVAGDMPPDVIFFARYAVAEWAARGAFLPLDEYVKRDLEQNHPDAILPERFYKPAWEESLYRGKLYSIPNGIDTRALVYNKDLFRRAGLVDEKGNPTPPKTWDELREYSKKLTQFDENGNVKVLGFSPNYGNCWLYMYAWMNDAEFLSPDGLTCTLNDPKCVEALQFIVDLYKDAGGYQQVMAFQAGLQGGALDPLIQGKIAMKIDVDWVMNWYSQVARDMDLGVASPPVSPRLLAKRQTEVSWGGGWCYSIPINARNKEAAWDFIRFMVSDRAFEIFMKSEKERAESQGRLFIPIMLPIKDLNEKYFNEYVLYNPRVPLKIREGCRVFVNLIPISRCRPVTPVGQLLWNRHTIATEEACYGKKTPKAALDYGTAIVQKELDQVNHPRQGKPIDWRFFFLGYPLVIIGMFSGAYLWDTRIGFRKKLARIFSRKHKISKEDLVQGSRGGYFRSQWWAGFIFVSPWVIGFIVFGGGPLLFSILMSFCDYDILKPAQWIGMENYRYLLGEDELVPKAMANTLFMVIGIPIGMAASLGIALLLNAKIKGISVWRTFFYLPAIIPGVASFIIWIWMLNPAGGLINQVLKIIGVHGPNWLGSETWSKPSFIFMGLWGAGGGMLIWLAGLKDISEQYYEAAAIDGATRLQQFRHITLPMLTPYIFFNLVMGMIGVFQIFDIAFIMTGGGPVNSTLFYVYHLFNNAFRYGHMGYASAMAWILFIIILILTVIQLKTAKHWVHYGSEL
jgi:ABC-type sugar transport system permease subunit/ABC-type glycerol-3-phosphate transport system substrate-binding protein